MRILWICGARVAGGAERTTAQVAALLRQRGHALAVAHPPGSRLAALDALGALERLEAPLGGARNLRAWAAVARLLAQRRPDVALITTVDEWVWACLSRCPPATRLVLARHMALPLARRVRWLAARRADAVVAVSEAVRDSLAGVPAERLHVIHNPVRFAPRAAPPTAEERRAARAALGLPASGHLIGFFGGGDAAKGLADVLAAVRAVARALGETHLLVCGRGAVGALPAAAELAGRVHARGEIDDVAGALTAADVVVMATQRRLSEALPATLLEAMACGTPVAAYATGGMREAIGADGVAGRLAAPDDAGDLARVVTAILADREAATRLGVAALARVRTLFDPARAADRYEQLFASL